MDCEFSLERRAKHLNGVFILIKIMQETILICKFKNRKKIIYCKNLPAFQMVEFYFLERIHLESKCYPHRAFFWHEKKVHHGNRTAGNFENALELYNY